MHVPAAAVVADGKTPPANQSAVQDTGSVSTTASFSWDVNEERRPSCGNIGVVRPNSDISSYNVQSTMLDRSASSTASITLTHALAALLLSNSLAHNIPASYDNHHSHDAADAGATYHMCPDRSVFLSYHSYKDHNMCMRNKGLAPILDRGTAVISLNDKPVIVRTVLHIPSLRNTIFSLHKHQIQPGCGHIGNEDMGGLYMYISSLALTVNTSVDCHISYSPIRPIIALRDMAYAQPKCQPIVAILTKVLPPDPPPLPPWLNWRSVKYARHSSKQALSPPASPPQSLTSFLAPPNITMLSTILVTISVGI